MGQSLGALDVDAMNERTCGGAAALRVRVTGQVHDDVDALESGGPVGSGGLRGDLDVAADAGVFRRRAAARGHELVARGAEDAAHAA